MADVWDTLNHFLPVEQVEVVHPDSKRWKRVVDPSTGSMHFHDESNGVTSKTVPEGFTDDHQSDFLIVSTEQPQRLSHLAPKEERTSPVDTGPGMEMQTTSRRETSSQSPGGSSHKNEDGFQEVAQKVSTVVRDSMSTSNEFVMHRTSDAEDDTEETTTLITTPTQSRYQILGGHTQTLHIDLEPGEEVLAEPGVFMHMESHMSVRTTCLCSFERCNAGESQFVTSFKNKSREPKVLGLAAGFPSGKIVPVDLGDPIINGSLYCVRGAWIATLGKAEIDYSLDCRCLPCCCGQQGLRRQLLKGDGTVFLVGIGTIVRKDIKPYEKVIIDDYSLLAWSGTVGYRSRAAGSSYAAWCCSGEGLFNYVIDGGSEGGLLYLNSIYPEKYKAGYTY